MDVIVLCLQIFVRSFQKKQDTPGINVHEQVSFKTGADLIESIKNLFPPEHWSKIEISAPEMIQGSYMAKYLLAEIVNGKQMTKYALESYCNGKSELYIDYIDPCYEELNYHPTVTNLPKHVDDYCNPIFDCQVFHETKIMKIEITIHLRPENQLRKEILC